jgi:hypothetical protein
MLLASIAAAPMPVVPKRIAMSALERTMTSSRAPVGSAASAVLAAPAVELTRAPVHGKICALVDLIVHPPPIRPLPAILFS